MHWLINLLFHVIILVGEIISLLALLALLILIVFGIIPTVMSSSWTKEYNPKGEDE